MISNFQGCYSTLFSPFGTFTTCATILITEVGQSKPLCILSTIFLEVNYFTARKQNECNKNEMKKNKMKNKEKKQKQTKTNENEIKIQKYEKRKDKTNKDKN
jgi:hypothetical protein